MKRFVFYTQITARWVSLVKKHFVQMYTHSRQGDEQVDERT